MGYTLVDCGAPGTVDLDHRFYQGLQEAESSFLPKSEVGVALVQNRIMKSIN